MSGGHKRSSQRKNGSFQKALSAVMCLILLMSFSATVSATDDPPGEGGEELDTVSSSSVLPDTSDTETDTSETESSVPPDPSGVASDAPSEPDSSVSESSSVDPEASSSSEVDEDSSVSQDSTVESITPFAIGPGPSEVVTTAADFMLAYAALPSPRSSWARTSP